MTVYLVSYIFPPSTFCTGCHIHVWNLFHELGKKGIETKVFTSTKAEEPEVSQINTLFLRKIPIIFFIDTIIFSVILFLKLAFKMKKGDIIHTHGGGVHLSGVLLKLLLGKKIKFVMTQHITKTGKLRIGERTPEIYVYRLIEWLAYKSADNVICVSDFVRRECIDGGCKDEKVIVISNAIKTKRIEITPHKEFYLFAGTNFMRKGLDEMIDAYREYKKLGGRFEIRMIGKKNVFITEDGIKQLGWVSEQEKDNMFKDCFALLHPSIYDPCPTVVFEAMLYGKPVICFDTGGHADIIKQYDTGIICKNVSPEEMAKSMIDLERDEVLYSRCSDNAVNSVKNFFWENGIDKIIDVYDGNNHV